MSAEDPFCPRHGRASRPAETPGLRCDCAENRAAVAARRVLNRACLPDGNYELLLEDALAMARWVRGEGTK